MSVPAQVCVEEGCERPAKVKIRGLCGAHLERERRRRKGPPRRIFGERKPCAVEGCERPSKTPGVEHCKMHYYRLWRNGTLIPQLVRGERGPCGASECDQPTRRPGAPYCEKHQQRYVKHGDPSVVLVANYRGDAVTYEGAHERVRAFYGPAAAHRCVDCGERASEWSYDHSDPAPRVCERRGSPYSPDPQRYRPRCNSCHQRFDNAVSRSAPQPRQAG